MPKGNPPHPTRLKPHRGFTLVELLIAILIFALMSAMAYRALTAALESRAQIDRESRKWREVSLLFARMEQDFAVVANRPIRDSGDVRREPLDGKPEALNELDAPLAFTRMGLPGQGGALAAPQRVGYRLRGQAVEQLVWPVLDQAQRTVFAANPLLEGVAELRFRYLDASGQWQPRWPVQPGQSGQPGAPILPAAIEVALRLQSGESLTRVFALPPLVNPPPQ